jgi:hypothetical protein
MQRTPPETVLDLDVPEAFRAWLDATVDGAPTDVALELDLSALEVDEATTCAKVAGWLRAAGRRRALVLRSPPQVVAHTLYRIGATDGRHAVRIVEPRAEIGTSS